MQREIRSMRKEDLTALHMGLGMWIRNRFGLWLGNYELIESAAKALGAEGPLRVHPDDISHLIIVRLWEELREGKRVS